MRQLIPFVLLVVACGGASPAPESARKADPGPTLDPDPPRKHVAYGHVYAARPTGPVEGTGDACPDPGRTVPEGEWWTTLDDTCPEGSKRDDAGRCLTADMKMVGVYRDKSSRGDNMSITQYCDGLQHGAFVRLTSGVKTVDGVYLRGKRHGLWRQWYPDGSRKEELEYTNGEFDGIDKFWNKDGVLIQDRRWRNGKLVEE